MSKKSLIINFIDFNTTEVKELLADLEALSEKYEIRFGTGAKDKSLEDYRKRFKKLSGLEW